MSSRPSFSYVPGKNAWVLRGKSGVVIRTFPDTQAGLSLAAMMTRIGTSAAVPVQSTSVVASIPFIGVAKGDMLVLNPKGSIPAPLFHGGNFISGADNINAIIGNVDDSAVVTLPAIGWDITVFRPFAG